MIHRSALNEWPDVLPGDNERLEFLGDAVLGAVVADQLYHAFPEEPEGSLTNLRAMLVRKPSLAQWARRFDLGAYLILGRGEERRSGRERDSILAGALEAVIGAIYLDQGYDGARAFIAPLVAQALATGAEGGPLRPSPQTPDAKSELQRRVQARYGQLPVYRLRAVTGPKHRPTYCVAVEVPSGITREGVGPSKQAAEQDAARRALEALEGDDASDPLAGAG